MLYHYCNLESLKSIINNGTLRLYSAVHQKDQNECKWIYENKNILKDKFDKDFNEVFENDSDNIDSVFEEIQNTPDQEKYSPYISCFTSLKDSMKHWKEYTNCEGLSIGLDLSGMNFKKQVPEGPNSTLWDNFALVKVVYDDNEKLQAFYKFIDHLNSSFHKGILNHLRPPHLKYPMYNFNTVFKDANQLGWEKEIRLLYMHHPNVVQNCDKYEIHGPKTDINDGRHFFELKIKIFKEILQEVVIGPQTKINIYEIQQILNSKNMDQVQIINSQHNTNN